MLGYNNVKMSRVNAVEKQVEVSVIVLTYNSDLAKLKRTLKSIITQKSIQFEIIISDDGSAVFCSDEIELFFLENRFEKYRIVQRKENIGTVANYTEALKIAKGEYEYGISPGDCFFDDNCLKTMLDYTSSNQLDFCFGDAVYYSYINKKLIIEDKHQPNKPDLYNLKSTERKKTALFFGNNFVNGASLLRRTDAAIQVFQEILPHCKYMEDNTGLLLALYKGYRVGYCNREIVWYEYGTGISTKNNEKWNCILNDEWMNIVYYLKSSFPNDQIIPAWISFNDNKDNKLKDSVGCLLQRPKAFFLRVANKVYKEKRKTISNCEYMLKLKKVLEEKG